MARRCRKPASVRVIYADGRIEIRKASSFQKRAVVARGHGRRAPRASPRNERRLVSVALAQGRKLDRQWQEAEARDEGLPGADAA
jgi:hypothetical protein